MSKQQIKSFKVFLHKGDRSWSIGIITILLLGLSLTAPRVWAGPLPIPLHQTVPQLSPTPTNTPVPTVTPVGGQEPADDDGEDEENTDEVDSPQEESTQEVLGTVRVAVLNVRAGPSTDTEVIGTAFEDDVLEILGQNGDWWQVCCPFGQNESGWVSAQFVEPNFEISQIDLLVPQIDISTPMVESQSVEDQPIVSQIVSSEAILSLEIEQQPQFTWQNQPALFILTVRNIGTEDAVDLVLRDELPPELRFIASNVEADGQLTRALSERGGTIFTVQWPLLAPNEEVAVRITVQVSSDIVDSTILDNLAVVSASNASEYTAGIVISMPPTDLPDFK